MATKSKDTTLVDALTDGRCSNRPARSGCRGGPGTPDRFNARSAEPATSGRCPGREAWKVRVIVVLALGLAAFVTELILGYPFVLSAGAVVVSWIVLLVPLDQPRR